MLTADQYIFKLGLEPHVEGGYFKETYRNSLTVPGANIAKNIDGERSLSTVIYFLLKSGQVSRFHQLKCDEIWFYHCGCAMTIHMIDEEGGFKSVRLGLNTEKGEMPQLLIPAGVVFGSEPAEKDLFSLVSCLVSPGFDFRDFKMFSANELIALFPRHKDVIMRLNG